MTFNVVMIFLILLLVGIGLVVYVKKTSGQMEEEDYENLLTVEYCAKVVKETFTNTQKMSVKESNMTKTEYERKERSKQEIKQAKKSAVNGDLEAKRFIKTIIKDILQAKHIGKVNPENIDIILGLDSPETLKKEDKFGILLFLWNHDDGPQGFTKNFSKYGLDAPTKCPDGNIKYVVTKEAIDDVFEKELRQRGGLTYNEKIDYLTQRVYEINDGHGRIDMLFETTLDEIEIGASGIPADSYTIQTTDRKNIYYSYESIWIMYKGIPYHLACTSLESQRELVRICRNIYRYNAPYILSKKDAKIIASMKNGNRVTVSIPPFADSWNAVIRKFDSVPSIEPDKLLTDKGNQIPITIAKWMVKTYTNIIVSGDQGTGKTTFGKSILRFSAYTDLWRVYEMQAETNLRFAYPDRNIISMYETNDINLQDGLNFGKKLSGVRTIIGEIADAVATSYYVQSTRVASKCGFGTNHNKTLSDMLNDFADKMMEVRNGGDFMQYKSQAAEAITIDIHFDRDRGHRYIERISECIPIREQEYPLLLNEKMSETELSIADKINEQEYRKRLTDRPVHIENILMHFDKEQKCYVFDNFPSEGLWKKMCKEISAEEEQVMKEEFQKILFLSKTILENPEEKGA